ncbi:NCS1 family nucleobase:cation symporter-1 [Methylobacterium sp. NEAU 140]|uniref:NCS1 family nucleobase:cation symporter-1 n=1 Tax=Methylobacterium sp. NEAU 140 TaxID=3064945 RepID=UPI00273329DF|nr:NCS1 family nucleobase:cation symporter-1 [Methylobacterium sp. NEAU 140]MDP4022001.1 NCS1 family nucleobase:cation symporter-1 [Methylobacterium sp. NEAU 140]
MNDEITASASLWNEDLKPTEASARTWLWYHFASLWIGMVMCIPAYLLASGLINEGMSPTEAIVTVFLGNAIVLVPMLLVGHAGACYGIPFPVLARAAFGVRGAAIPATARALVACGWYGIQTWVGGSTLHTLIQVATGYTEAPQPVPGLGIGWSQLACFLVFWILQLFIVSKGMEAIKKLETWTAPFKILVCVALVWWAAGAGGGFLSVLQQPSGFSEGGPRAGQFWLVFWPSLTAIVGFWATLSLNIPDFTRFARSQSHQIIGQTIGLPGPMGFLTLVSVVTTSATVVVFGKAIWDPVALAGHFTGVLVLIGLLVIAIDTASCNLAANLVGPAYDFSSLAPRLISYRTGGYITAAIGVCIMPWRLVASSDGYIFTWLVGYSALLGPLAGVIVADYWLVRRCELSVAELYRERGIYRYVGGWNPTAIFAVLAGVLPNLPGFLHAVAPASFGGVGGFWIELYTYAWFVGFALAAAVYYALTKISVGAARTRVRPA